MIFFEAKNRVKYSEKSIFVHFDMTFLTILNGIFDFINLIFTDLYLNQLTKSILAFKVSTLSCGTKKFQEKIFESTDDS